MGSRRADPTSPRHDLAVTAQSVTDWAQAGRLTDSALGARAGSRPQSSRSMKGYEKQFKRDDSKSAARNIIQVTQGRVHGLRRYQVRGRETSSVVGVFSLSCAGRFAPGVLEMRKPDSDTDTDSDSDTDTDSDSPGRTRRRPSVSAPSSVTAITVTFLGHGDVPWYHTLDEQR